MHRRLHGTGMLFVLHEPVYVDVEFILEQVNCLVSLFNTAFETAHAHAGLSLFMLEMYRHMGRGGGG